MNDSCAGEIPTIGEWIPVPYPIADEVTYDASPWLTRLARIIDQERDPGLKSWRALEFIGQCDKHSVYPPATLMRWIAGHLRDHFDAETEAFWNPGPVTLKRSSLDARLGIASEGTGKHSKVLKYFDWATRHNRMMLVGMLVALGAKAATACDLVAERYRGVKIGPRHSARTLLDKWHEEYKDMLVGTSERKARTLAQLPAASVQQFLDQFPEGQHRDAVIKQIANGNSTV